MSSFLELSSPSVEERLNGGAAAPNDESTGAATRNKEPEKHVPSRHKHIGMIEEYASHNDHMEENNDNAMDTNKDAAAQNTLQNESPILIIDDENEVPQSYGCSTDIPLPDAERIDDAAAISVMAYLLLIAFLLALAILIGTVVVSQYGFIIFVAVVIAIGALLLVVLIVVSVIQGDRKLTKARSQIHKWSMEVKEVIMKEIADLQEDYANYSSGMLLLTYEGELFSATPDYVRDGFDNKEINSKRRRRPKSMIFRLAISPLKKLGRRNQKGSNSTGMVIQKKNKQESRTVTTTKKRSWFGKRKKTTTDVAVANYEEGPSANYFVPPSEKLEIV
mmetsp:Transcript_22002/g.35994  ORF Transcript_22002/g.35994 Transcript_22002/m.35994 type:complete len:334 (+) Transcript_22002:113-1114(+)